VKLPRRGLHYINRYREIIRVLVKYGFSGVIEQLELLPAFDLPRRILQSVRPQPDLPLGIPQRLRLALEELGPTFVKLGQVLGTRPDLIPPAYIAELVKLQDAVPPAEWEPVKAQIESELGASLEELFDAFDRIPIAAASLAQVYTATLPDGSEVVVKVQRPNIEPIIEVDLEILSDLAGLLQTRTSLGEIYNLPEIVDDFAITMRAELDYRREGRNADCFRANFAAETYLHIPQVYWDYSTRRVLVLERISGIKIDDIEALDAAGYDCNRIALRAARMIVKEVLEDSFFHADPHPGNFIVMPGEIIGAMDFGMVGYLGRRERANLIRLYIVAVQLDDEGIVEQLIRMGAAAGRVNREGLQRDVARLLRNYQGLPLKEIRAREVIEDVMLIAFRHHLHLPSEYWLLGKTLAMMEGVGLKLAPDFDIFAVSKPYVQRFMWRQFSPRTLGEKALRGGQEWGDLVLTLPRRLSHLLDDLGAGDLSASLHLPEIPALMIRLDRIANRLSISILLAALIMGLATLVPAFNLTEQVNLATILVITSFAVVSLLSLWLIFSIWRSGRGR